MRTIFLLFILISFVVAQDWLNPVKAQIEQCQNLKQVDSLVQRFEQQYQHEPEKLLVFYNSVLRFAYSVRERQIRTIATNDQETLIKIGKSIAQQFTNLGNRITLKAADLCEKVNQDSINDELRAYCKTFKIMAANLRFENELRSKPRPDFVFTDLAGKQHHLYDFKGKYVLLHFWNMHSTPCVEELPFLQQAYQKYGSKGLTIINFHLTVGHPDAQWEAEALKNFIHETQMPGIHVTGKQVTAIKEQYFVRNFPTLFLLNPESIVIKPSATSNRLRNELQGQKLLESLKEVLEEISN